MKDDSSKYQFIVTSLTYEDNEKGGRVGRLDTFDL